MRYALAFLLMLIFSFQAVPVKKISKLISKAQTEDVQDTADADDDDDSGSINPFNTDVIIPAPAMYQPLTGNIIFENKVSVIIHTTEALPFVPLAKIPSPPPEC